MSDVDMPQIESDDDRPGLRPFTLHIDFLAADDHQACQQAVTYAEGLNQLRPEVDGYTARVSPAEAWSQVTAVFCGAAGPHDMDMCVDAAGHGGLHHGPGGSWLA